jgi:hypothetical protein
MGSNPRVASFGKEGEGMHRILQKEGDTKVSLLSAPVQNDEQKDPRILRGCKIKNDPRILRG